MHVHKWHTILWCYMCDAATTDGWKLGDREQEIYINIIWYSVLYLQRIFLIKIYCFYYENNVKYLICYFLLLFLPQRHCSFTRCLCDLINIYQFQQSISLIHPYTYKIILSLCHYCAQPAIYQVSETAHLITQTVVWIQLSFTGSCVQRLGPQLVALFGRLKTFGHGTLLEEVDLWKYVLRLYTTSLFAKSYLSLKYPDLNTW